MLRRTLLATAPCLLALAACQPEPPPTTAVMEMEAGRIVATIESVDRTKREVLLSGPRGGLLTVRAGQQVRNFDRLRAGQRVAVRYDAAVAAWMAPATAGPPSATVVAAAARSAQGQRPAGAVGGLVQVQVIVEAVDVAANTVSFVGPAGVLRTVTVRDPRMQQLLPTLKPGDRIDVLYEEALALDIQPMGA
jgi:hypothetical protein